MKLAYLAALVLSAAVVAGLWFGIPDDLKGHLSSSNQAGTTLEMQCIADDTSATDVWVTLLKRDNGNGCLIDGGHASTTRNTTLVVGTAVAVAMGIIMFKLATAAIVSGPKNVILLLVGTIVAMIAMQLLAYAMTEVHYYWRVIGIVNLTDQVAFWLLYLLGGVLAFIASVSLRDG